MENISLIEEIWKHLKYLDVFDNVYQLRDYITNNISTCEFIKEDMKVISFLLASYEPQRISSPEKINKYYIFNSPSRDSINFCYKKIQIRCLFIDTGKTGGNLLYKLQTIANENNIPLVFPNSTLYCSIKRRDEFIDLIERWGIRCDESISTDFNATEFSLAVIWTKNSNQRISASIDSLI